MHNVNDGQKFSDWNVPEWTKKDSEHLVKLYLKDYYETLDEYYLREAIQISQDDGLNFERIMREVRFQQE